MTRTYYVLRFEQTDALHQRGEQLMNADHALRIGQTATCDVRLPNDSQWEDAEWAVIEKTGEGCWRLVGLSPYKEHEVRVNGVPIPYVCLLRDGDRISFGALRQELLFSIRHDEQYNQSGITVVARGSRLMAVWMAIITLLACGGVALYLQQRPISNGMISEAEPSVFKIVVDSISLVQVVDGDTVMLDTYSEDIPGIAFLTTDSLLVTARHCLEPWLNVSDTAQLDTTMATPLPYRWAVKAETYNALEAEDDSMMLVSYCSVWDTDSAKTCLFSLRSVDFRMNKSRDLVIEGGDFEHLYIWRSISARSQRTDMMLGDIAYLPTRQQGTIRLASTGDMQELCQQEGQDIVILGNPSGSIKGRGIEKSRDVVRKPLQFDEQGYPSVVISHNGDIAPGFSGGPVLTKQGMFGWCAIGVISVSDKQNMNRCYSVPVTEIARMRQQNE